MELTHTFTVPATVGETWAAFEDIESVAECFPGATVTEVSGDDFKGSCKVKLGPISLVYSGSGTFVEKDEEGRRFKIEAKGKDKRGNGTAGANVTATFAEEGADSTTVSVLTDLAITGKPAQFGRGVIQDVSDKLLQQFVDCLQAKVGASDAGAEAGADAGAEVATGAAVTQTEASGPAASEAALSASGDETAGDVDGARKTPSTAYAGASAGGSPGASPGSSGSSVSASSGSAASSRDNDALDLGATVLPILAKNYWKQALGGFAVLVFLVLVIRKVF